MAYGCQRRRVQGLRDILRREREDERHEVVRTGAVSKAKAANIAGFSDQLELVGHWLRHGASVCGGGDRVPSSRARNRAGIAELPELLRSEKEKALTFRPGPFRSAPPDAFSAGEAS